MYAHVCACTRQRHITIPFFSLLIFILVQELPNFFAMISSINANSGGGHSNRQVLVATCTISRKAWHHQHRYCSSLVSRLTKKDGLVHTAHACTDTSTACSYNNIIEGTSKAILIVSAFSGVPRCIYTVLCMHVMCTRPLLSSKGLRMRILQLLHMKRYKKYDSPPWFICPTQYTSYNLTFLLMFPIHTLCKYMYTL